MTIPRGGNTLAVILRTLAYGARVQIRQENAWTSAETGILKSRVKISVEFVWRHV